jgi:hypothetical protein
MEIKNAPTAHNRIVYASPLRARAPKNRSRAAPFVRFSLRHIWGRGQCFALPYYMPQTSYTTFTLGEIGAEIFVNIRKNH